MFNERQLSMMSVEDRKKLGAAGQTMKEAFSKAEAKNEREMQAEIEAFCRLKGWPCYRQQMHKRSSSTTIGQPDFIVCVPHEGEQLKPAKFAAIECKLPGCHPTPEQREQLALIWRNHGAALVATSAKQAIDFLLELTR